MNVLTPTKLGANDDQDMVIVTFGELRPRFAYQTGLQIAHALRMAAKSAARHDHAPGSFWSDVSMEDLDDCPRPNREFRRSRQAPNVTNWAVKYKNTEVSLEFDGEGKIFGYEDAIKLHQRIRRASRRAKAWAGDGSRNIVLLANMTTTEADDRLGI